MKTELYGSATLPIDGGPEVIYSLLRDETGAIGRMQCELYGVRVEMEGESASRPGLTASRAAIYRLLETLLNGTVPPIALDDVVEDWKSL